MIRRLGAFVALALLAVAVAADGAQADLGDGVAVAAGRWSMPLGEGRPALPGRVHAHFVDTVNTLIPCADYQCLPGGEFRFEADDGRELTAIVRCLRFDGSEVWAGVFAEGGDLALDGVVYVRDGGPAGAGDVAGFLAESPLACGNPTVGQAARETATPVGPGEVVVVTRT